MKFHDLAIGQRFELNGETYVKTSPVLASKEEGGGNKFFARYVLVQPFDSADQRPAASAEKMLQAGVVLTAFDAYHAHCRETLERLAGDIPAERFQEMADTLEEGRLGFLDATLKG